MEQLNDGFTITEWIEILELRISRFTLWESIEYLEELKKSTKTKNKLIAIGQILDRQERIANIKY